MDDWLKKIEIYGPPCLAVITFLGSFCVSKLASKQKSSLDNHLKSLEDLDRSIEDLKAALTPDKFGAQLDAPKTNVLSTSQMNAQKNIRGLSSVKQVSREALLDITIAFDNEVELWLDNGRRADPNPDAMNEFDNLRKRLQSTTAFSQKQLDGLHERLENLTHLILASILDKSDRDLEPYPRRSDTALQRTLTKMADLAGLDLIAPMSGDIYSTALHESVGVVSGARGTRGNSINKVIRRGLKRRNIVLEKAVVEQVD